LCGLDFDPDYFAYLDILLQPMPNMAAPQSFTLFPKLPIELRAKIWRETFTGRNVGTYNLDAKPLPIVGLVNKEAMAEVRRRYHVVIDSPTYRPFDGRVRAFINYGVDTLVVHQDEVDIRQPVRRELLQRVVFIRRVASFPLSVTSAIRAEWSTLEIDRLDERISRALPRLREVWNCFHSFPYSWYMEPRRRIESKESERVVWDAFRLDLC
jgi:hypothetical protein